MMRGSRIPFGSIAALLLLATGSAAQPAMDCRQAKTEAEKAICGNSDLAAADKRMADAYTAFRAELPPDQQKALLADQRRWITRRAAACGEKSDDALVQCLLAETDARRRMPPAPKISTTSTTQFPISTAASPRSSSRSPPLPGARIRTWREWLWCST
jgi:uncharacterized protein